MTEFFSTLFICILIAAALFLAIRKLWKDKKQGKTCCGGGCSGCCHCADIKKK